MWRKNIKKTNTLIIYPLQNMILFNYKKSKIELNFNTYV